MYLITLFKSLKSSASGTVSKSLSEQSCMPLCLVCIIWMGNYVSCSQRCLVLKRHSYPVILAILSFI